MSWVDLEWITVAVRSGLFGTEVSSLTGNEVKGGMLDNNEFVFKIDYF